MFVSSDPASMPNQLLIWTLHGPQAFMKPLVTTKVDFIHVTEHAISVNLP